MELSLAELAERTGTEVRGNTAKRIAAIAAIEHATAAEISFVRDRQYARFLDSSAAGALILPPELAQRYQGDCLVSPNPYLTYAKVAVLLNPPRRPDAGIHPGAVIAPDVVLGEAVSIGPHVSVGAGCRIGDRVVLEAGCTLARDCELGEDSWLHARVALGEGTRIGRRVTIHSGAVLGADGFGFVPEPAGWYKIPQIGIVWVDDDAEIGANTTIDRAALGETRIGRGVKLDNLIHIAHNVQLGDHTVIAACTGIAGSAKIGAWCQISGMVSIAGHLNIADRVTITATSFVINSINESGVYSSGTTVDEHGLWRRNAVRFRQLDQLARRVQALEKQLNTEQNKQGM